MPDANKGGTWQQMYAWVYNGGAYGRKPGFREIIEKGWYEAILAGYLVFDVTNQDLRLGVDSSGRRRMSHYINLPTSTPTRVTTTDDTPKALSSSTGDGGLFIASVYQSSGGNLDFYVLTSANDTVYIQSTIPTATWTAFAIPTALWGYATKCKWSAAAGASQLAAIQTYGTSEK